MTKTAADVVKEIDNIAYEVWTTGSIKRQAVVDLIEQHTAELNQQLSDANYNFQMLALNWYAPKDSMVSVVTYNGKPVGVCYPDSQAASEVLVNFPKVTNPGGED